MSLDIAAEAQWPGFDFFSSAAEIAVENCAALRGHDVWADGAALCALSEDLSPELRVHAAQMLAHTLGQLQTAADRCGGLDARTAQARVDALTRVCMNTLAYDRGN